MEKCICCNAMRYRASLGDLCLNMLLWHVNDHVIPCSLPERAWTTMLKLKLKAKKVPLVSLG